MSIQTNYYLILPVGAMLRNTILHRYPYHMILAQQYRSSSDYRGAVNLIAANPRTTLILDNGAHENRLMDPLDYWQVIEDLQPNMVVCPDLIGQDWEDSFQVSTVFGEAMLRRYPHIKCIFAGQGRNKDEILKCYSTALAKLDPERWIIGFGQAYLTWEDENEREEVARAHMIRDLVDYEGLPHLQKHTFHLLGARWRAHAFTYARSFLKIQGIDSVKPFTCARQGHIYPRITDGDRKTDLLGNDEADTALITLSIDRFCAEYAIKPTDWSQVYECKSA